MTLHKGELKAYISEVKARHEDDEENKSPLVISGFANMATKDRAGDIIPGRAWTNALRNYEKNPIILYNHNYNNPIGKMTGYEILEGGLRIEAEISPAAPREYALIRDGVLKTFSVGFSIESARYDDASDTYVIDEVGDLYEISVVAVPCNQDSTFELKKSLKDFDSFEREYRPSPNKTIEKEVKITMDENKLQDTITSLFEKKAAELQEKQEAEKRAKEAKERQEKELNSIIETKFKSAAEKLVETLQDSMSKSSETFADKVKELEKHILENKEEIESRLENRNKQNKMRYLGRSEATREELQHDMQKAWLLGIATNKGLEGTRFGSQAVEKVNTSSSYRVSSDDYETLFGTELQRDIQNELVMAPLFRTIEMNQANMVLPIRPNAGLATWVSTSQYGTDASTGTENTVALTETTLRTHKLATKSYMTDETSEDAILPLLPLIREDLVRNHAEEIENSITTSTGSNTYKGLIQLAADGTNKVETTEATFDGATKVTALMLLKGRRRLSKWGLNIRDLVFVVSEHAFYDLHEDPAYADVEQVGVQDALKLTGQVGRIYNIPVIVNQHFAAPAAGGVFGLCLNARNFLRPTLRNIEVQSDYDVEKQRRVIVATQRVGFEQIISGQAVVSYRFAS